MDNVFTGRRPRTPLSTFWRKCNGKRICTSEEKYTHKYMRKCFKILTYDYEVITSC